MLSWGIKSSGRATDEKQDNRLTHSYQLYKWQK